MIKYLPINSEERKSLFDPKPVGAVCALNVAQLTDNNLTLEDMNPGPITNERLDRLNTLLGVNESPKKQEDNEQTDLVLDSDLKTSSLPVLF